MEENDSVTKENKRKFELASEKLQVLGRLQAIEPMLEAIELLHEQEHRRLKEINNELELLGEGQTVINFNEGR
jgi:hypothetical protein